MNSIINPSFRSKIQTMSSLIRYNNAIHIHDENVAEHSFYVALFTMAICDFLMVPTIIKYFSIQRALIHDVHEIELSDIPHNVKEEFPRLNDICLNFEEQFNNKHFPRMIGEEEAFGLEHMEVVNTIVVLADVLSVLQYSEQELSFGNKKFEEIKELAISRIEDSLNTLNKHFNKDQIFRLHKEIFLY